MGFLELCDLRQTRRIAKQKPKKGYFAQLSSEFGDVWHEIESVFQYKEKDDGFEYSSISIYCHRENVNPIESHRFCRMRKISKTLPSDARCIFVKEGAFTERTGNLDKIPKRIKSKIK